MITVIFLMAGIAALLALLSWVADRKPCPHTNLIRLDDFDSICESCEAWVPTRADQ